MIKTFPLLISYSQVAVFSPLNADNFNIWTDEHVAQGFSWREGCAVFGIPDHDGESIVEVVIEEPIFKPSEDSVRCIEVPFRVFDNNFGVGTIHDACYFDIDPGNYSLMFELKNGELLGGKLYAYKISLSFSKNKNPVFNILKKSGEMTSSKVLVTTAQSAI